MLIALTAITVGAGHRKIVPKAVKDLKVSIETLGLQTPITVRPGTRSGSYVLVAGRHRLEVARRLGWAEIEANVLTDKLDADLWEIAENLHRADLTKMQRHLQIGRWVLLQARKIKRDQKAEVVHRGPPGSRIRGGRQPRDGGISAAARELGVPKATAMRAVAISRDLTPAAQQAATELGLENRTGLLEMASRRRTPEAQVLLLQDYASRQIEQERIALQTKAILAGTDPPRDAGHAFEQWYKMLDHEWRRKVRLWLRKMDPIALADELDQWAELAAEDAKALH